MNTQKKYNEFTVQLENGQIVQKMPTLRKSVMIYPFEAERLNNVVRQTKTYYELADEVKKVIQEPKKETILDGEELKKDLTLEKLMEYSEAQVNAAFLVMSKKAMLDLVGVKLSASELQQTKHGDCIEIAKKKLSEIKSK
jgi:predicted RNase H-like HicB family nuclease